jgi:excisionase family DNA binding protein
MQPPEPTVHEQHPRHERRAWSISALSRATGIGRTRLYEEIRCKRLRAKKLGSRTLIPTEAADAWLAQLPDYQGT